MRKNWIFQQHFPKPRNMSQMFKDDDAAAKELTFLQSRVGKPGSDAASDTSEADTDRR